MEDKRRHDRDYIQRKRGTTNEGDDRVGTTDKFTEDTVIRDGVTMPRYVTLSDGQVMDRAYKPDIKPLSGWMIQAIRASNRTYANFIPIKERGDKPPIMYALADLGKREKLRRICQELKQRNLLDRLYYGLREPVRFDRVAELLTALT